MRQYTQKCASETKSTQKKPLNKTAFAEKHANLFFACGEADQNTKRLRRKRTRTIFVAYSEKSNKFLK